MVDREFWRKRSAIQTGGNPVETGKFWLERLLLARDVLIEETPKSGPSLLRAEPKGRGVHSAFPKDSLQGAP